MLRSFHAVLEVLAHVELMKCTPLFGNFSQTSQTKYKHVWKDPHHLKVCVITSCAMQTDLLLQQVLNNHNSAVNEQKIIYPFIIVNTLTDNYFIAACQMSYSFLMYGFTGLFLWIDYSCWAPKADCLLVISSWRHGGSTSDLSGDENKSQESLEKLFTCPTWLEWIQICELLQCFDFVAANHNKRGRISTWPPSCRKQSNFFWTQSIFIYLWLSTFGAEKDGVAAEEGSVLSGICCCSRMLDHHHILVAGLTAPLKGSKLDNLKLPADCVKK